MGSRPPRFAARSKALGRILRVAFVLSAAVSAALPGQTWPTSQVRKGTLAFDARATLGDFTGTTDSVRGQLTGGDSLAAVRGWVEAPVSSFRTGNGRRDRDLLKSMESEVHPFIRFELEGVEPLWERGDSASVVLVGRFTIHGETRPERLNALVHRGSEGIRVTTELPMNVKDYKVGGLSKFLGTFKMHPDIKVRVDVTFGA
jgi:polyisoprenoid-binding protein YceI